MFKTICVTNRNICEDDFLKRIDALLQLEAPMRPDAIVLREKDLSMDSYEKLAKDVLAVCRKNEIPCILHNFSQVAVKLNHPVLHLPLPVLRTLKKEERDFFTCLGTSCHSVEDAKEAKDLGCTYIMAGHIYETDCKKGLSGRGLAFLEDVCRISTIPVYAIGGITREKYAQLEQAGAAGACCMSGFMKKEI